MFTPGLLKGSQKLFNYFSNAIKLACMWRLAACMVGMDGDELLVLHKYGGDLCFVAVNSDEG
jgi:hypothetical protein